MLRPRDGSAQSTDSASGHVATRNAHLGRIQRRTWQCDLHVQGWRYEMDQTRGARIVEASSGEDRCRDCPYEFEPLLCVDPDEGPRLAVEIRRRWGALAYGKLPAAANRTCRLLHSNRRLYRKR